MLQRARSQSIGEEPFTLTASLFGPFKLCDTNDEDIVISNRRACALLGMLCLLPTEPIDRELISKLLWPGRFQTQARASLRQCLLNLSKILDASGADILDISRTHIRLKPDIIQTDLMGLEQALSEKDYVFVSDRLKELGSKPLLGQMDLGAPFQEWLNAQRHHIEGRLQIAVSENLAELKSSNNVEDYMRLLSAWKLRAPESSLKVRKKDEALRLAVLPFRSLTEPDDQGFLADGLVDELITTLGQVPQLRIAGRTSSFQFKNVNSSIAHIAKQLNVSHLLEGAVHRHDDQLRISVSLIDGANGFEVWSDSYDGSVDDVFAAREDVSRAIANGLMSSLNLTAHDLRPRTLTKSRQAYGLYLQGRALTLRAIGEGVLGTAKDLLKQALEIDPDFAECWTALAEAHVYTSVFTPCHDKLAETERMAECAKRAIALSPQQGHARAMLGLYNWTKNDVVGALDLAFEAYLLEPENPAVTLRLGSFLLYCGRTKAALPYIEMAIDQDPVEGKGYAILSTAYLNLGRIEEAIAAGQRMVDLGQPSMHLAAATAASGNRALAVEQHQKTRLLINTVMFPPAGSTPMSPEVMDTYWKMAAEGIYSGSEENRSKYCQILEMLHASLPDSCDHSIVWPAIWMGYSSMVFRTLGSQITPPNMVGLMSLWTDIEPIRQTRLHPDFMSFAENIGLVAAWEKYGWPDLMPDPQALSKVKS